MIYPIVSNITRRAYNPITTERGLVLRCNHERLRLKRVERKDHLARIRQDTCDDVLTNACSPANHALGDTTSPLSNDSKPNGGWIDTDYYNWCVMNVSICDWLFTCLNLFIRITYFIFVLIQIIISRIVDRRCIFISPRRLFIYLCHIIDVTFMPFFLFSYQTSDLLIKLIIVYSSVTSDVRIDSAFCQLVIVSLLCWWCIVFLLYWWCHKRPLIRNVKLI